MSRSRLHAWAMVLALVIVGPAVTSAHERVAPRAASTHECTCEVARSTHGWCDACGVGYVASLRVPSLDFFDLVDAHGHEVDLSDVSCRPCHAALESNGFCEEHGIGYSEGFAYVTRLAYLLARGEPVETTRDYARLRDALALLDTCELCALAAFADGRCPRCDIHYRDGKNISTAKETR